MLIYKYIGIMKHFSKLVILVCLLSVQCGILWAQTLPLSQVVRHDDIKGKEVITRAIHYGWEVTCSKSVNGDGKHTFMFYSQPWDITKHFTCHLGELFKGSSTYDYCIKDMYIFEDKCYFCGYYRNLEYEPIYDPFGNPILQGGLPHGFVGYFKIFPTASIFPLTLGEEALSANPPFPTHLIPFVDYIYMMDVPYTDSIMQIVAHHDDDSYDVFLMAVGYVSQYLLQNAKPTCVVELKKPFGTSDIHWSLNIVQPNCAETDEYLTDIALIKDSVVVSSKLQYADGELDGDTDPSHYIFRLHTTKRAGFYTLSALPNNPAKVYQYDLQPYGSSLGCHHIGEPIRLCPLSGYEFCVYYSYERRDPPPPYNGLGGPCVFWMSGAATMTDFKYRPYHTHSRSIDAVSLDDKYFSIALLHYSDNFPNGEVSFPTLEAPTSTLSFSHSLLDMTMNLQSLDFSPYRKLVEGGSFDNYSLLHHFQAEEDVRDFPTPCFYLDDNIFYTDEALAPAKEDCQWERIYFETSFYADTAHVEMSTCERVTMCIKEPYPNK